MENTIEFDEIAAQKGFVRVITPLVDTLLARAQIKTTAGEWIESTSPAIYLGFQDSPAQDYPRIILSYNGDSNASTAPFEEGVLEVVNPATDLPEFAPYNSTYIQYVLTLTCDSGENTMVSRGERASSATILRKIRDGLVWDHIKDTVHTEMCSTINNIAAITPTYKLEATSYHNSSTLSFTFDTISTIFDFSSVGWFDTITYDGLLERGMTGSHVVTRTVP